MIQSLTLVTPPTGTVVSLEELREHLRIYPCGSPPESPDDALIQRLALIAETELDGADGWLGRALIDQEWRLARPMFPPCNMPLMLPLTSPRWSGASPAPVTVESLDYTAPDGTVTVMVEGVDFEVITDYDPQYLRPIWGQSWPSTRCQSDAVRVRYNAGYGPTGDDVPPVIHSYILLRVGQLFEYRELVGAAAAVAPVPYMQDMLENVRMRGWVCARDA